MTGADEFRYIPVSKREAASLKRRLFSKPRKVGKRWDSGSPLKEDLYIIIEAAIRDHGGESIPRLSEIVADALQDHWSAE